MITENGSAGDAIMSFVTTVKDSSSMFENGICAVGSCHLASLVEEMEEMGGEGDGFLGRFLIPFCMRVLLTL